MNTDYILDRNTLPDGTDHIEVDWEMLAQIIKDSIAFNNPDNIQDALDQGVNLKALQDLRPDTLPFITAASHKRLEIIEMLAKAGLDPEEKNSNVDKYICNAYTYCVYKDNISTNNLIPSDNLIPALFRLIKMSFPSLETRQEMLRLAAESGKDYMIKVMQDAECFSEDLLPRVASIVTDRFTNVSEETRTLLNTILVERTQAIAAEKKKNSIQYDFDSQARIMQKMQEIPNTRKTLKRRRRPDVRP